MNLRLSLAPPRPLPQHLGSTLLLIFSLALVGCGGGGGSSSAGNPPAPTPISDGGGTSNPPPVVTPSLAEQQAAARFLSRTTFGPDSTLVAEVAELTPEVWLEQQFSRPVGRHLPIVAGLLEEHGFDVTAKPPPGLFRRFALFEQVMTAPDPLRQRVAYALSQIFVVSDKVDDLFTNPLALSSWYDMLLSHSFGNFRDLLRDVTLHPAMGLYLSHVNNGKTDPVANTFPDENYAREVMQLFSIGLFQLRADGSQVTDSSGQPVPTYDNNDIRAFSQIFTGLSYADNPFNGTDAFFGNPEPVLHLPMAMFEVAHEPGAKQLLNGQVVPGGQPGMRDIDDAVDNLFNHPNVGPFIGLRLIQRLVTSNPSPAYVARVSAAFDGDGTSPRGDMRAVLRAVLLDPEAVAPIDPAAAAGSGAVAGGGGKLREPFLRYTALFRGLGASSSDGSWPVAGYVVQFLTGQYPLSAPSVFNFYQPDFLPVGPLADANLVAPELQITTDSTIVGMTNLLAFALFGSTPADTPEGFATVQLDLAPFETLAADPDALLDHIDTLFTYGTLSEETRAAVRGIIAPISGQPGIRARTALYLVLASPDYAIEL